MNRALTENEYAVLISELPGSHIRDQCIILFMLQGGLRNGETCNLRWCDVCIGNEVFHTIRVINGHSRLKKRRYITLTSMLIERIKQYVDWYEKKYSFRYPDKKMFLTHNRKDPIQPRDVQRIVGSQTRRYLQEGYTPHSLRHTFATRLLRCTNIRVVQQLLGHDSLTSTEIYTHPNSDDRENAINQAF